MDFIRDGQVSWPTDAEDAEALLKEVDFFEIGSMVLPLVEELKKIKFGGGTSTGGSSGEGVLGGGAGTTASAASGPCDSYRLDMTAASFGDCKCGCVRLVLPPPAAAAVATNHLCYVFTRRFPKSAH